MTATIYHNPRCGTSRKVLEALVAAGQAPVVVEYLKAGWSEPQLRQLFAAAGLAPRQALRTRQHEAAALAGASDAAILKAMVAEPVLVERPFVTTAKGTRLCRPPERLNEIL